MNRPILLLFLFVSSLLSAQGTVYIIMGSDTGIWNGLDTKKYHHDYGLELYTDPAQNAYQVMDPAFRAPMTDSYGTPLKMTWWMMSGNTFRHSNNRNVPYPNSMTFWLMKEYHGENLEINGDELTLHYHTFYWSDYDQDGVFFYNQAQTFLESMEDFEYTLCQNLIDENVFPVSFRSGWHAMDNDWQHYLEDVLPFSMHNAYPSAHIDTVEPLDNLYDWSLAPSFWEPYHPDYDNYQIPGNLDGYNLRSMYMESVNTSRLNDMFQKASQGHDQMACIWAHLPESDFLYNIQRVDSLLQVVSANYPDVKFKYCTGIEAMQDWLSTGDETKPEITIDQFELNGGYLFEITTDELLFQSQPFVAVKDIYERYTRLDCQRIGVSKWRTRELVDKNRIAKLGIAVTDTSGNLNTKFINFLPDDNFYDNTSSAFSAINGNWSAAPEAAWREDAIVSAINQGDSVSYAYTFTVPATERYNLFIQVPCVINPVEKVKFELERNGNKVQLSKTNSPIAGEKWHFTGSSELESGTEYKLVVTGINNTNEVQNLAADVFKISALVRDRELNVDKEQVDLLLVSINQPRDFSINFGNRGYENVTVNGITSLHGLVTPNFSVPFTIEGHTELQKLFTFTPEQLGAFNDTLIISSDDYISPSLKIAVTGFVEPPFQIVDNDDPGYSETGTWNTSVTQAYGNSSRFTYINQSIGTSAVFTVPAANAGKYEVYMIIPGSTNSANHALYELYRNDTKIAETWLNQNDVGNIWYHLFDGVFLTGDMMTVKVVDDGTSTVGPVLRADAVKFSQVSGTTSLDDEQYLSYKLEQNYPNPFNPVTNISFSLKEQGNVSLVVYDILGREVANILDEQKPAGSYTVPFDASAISSGVYFYRLKARSFISVKKMIVLK